MKKHNHPLKIQNNRILMDKNRIYTATAYNQSVYGEKIRRSGNVYFREWNPRRSKLAAAILKGFSSMPIEENSSVLYLGASTGTTVSHVADISYRGSVFAVEFSYDSFVKLYDLARRRNNIFPILEDANMPEKYQFFVGNPDIIYQDIAQRNQVQIFNENAKIFSTTKKAMLIIKARAIASNRTDRSIINSAVREIKDFKVREIIDLKPYDVGNYFVYLDKN
ncbi:MAG: fibrillarin-like rRNA/tRNA 2'-O-methyltransferase [Candidatus Thermoplasmatota archaeon]|nr:fibrillarin-like rRNA/tRNA 2'-O-methyltransferase [Candidatus Thermoplasmatota archaeon]